MNTKNKFRRKLYWILFAVAICVVSSINMIGSFASQNTELTETFAINTVQSVESESLVNNSSLEDTELPVESKETNTLTSELALNKVVVKPPKLGHFPYQ